MSTATSGSTVALSATPSRSTISGFARSRRRSDATAEMPVGLQLTVPAHAEKRLLAIALAAERVLGTAADRLGTPSLLAS